MSSKMIVPVILYSIGVLGFSDLMGGKTSLTLLYTNTTNGVLRACSCPRGAPGGMDRRMTLLRQLRENNDNVLLVDSGDIFSVFPDTVKALTALRIMKEMDYTFINLGDQELINGIPFIKGFIDQNELPIYSANIRYVDSGKNIYPLAPPYRIIDMNGKKIGLIGVIAQSSFKFFPKEKKRNIVVSNVDEELQLILKEFKKENVAIIIVVSHCGFSVDKSFAQKFGAIDVIVGGHSQTLLQEPVKINSTLIVQAGADGGRLGKLDLTFNDKGMIIKNSNELFELNRDVDSAPRVIEIIDRYKKAQTRSTTFWN